MRWLWGASGATGNTLAKDGGMYREEAKILWWRLTNSHVLWGTKWEKVVVRGGFGGNQGIEAWTSGSKWREKTYYQHYLKNYLLGNDGKPQFEILRLLKAWNGFLSSCVVRKKVQNYPEWVSVLFLRMDWLTTNSPSAYSKTICPKVILNLVWPAFLARKGLE